MPDNDISSSQSPKPRSAATLPRVFQAITGEELRQLIVKEIEMKMDQDPHFQRHLTYPLVSFAFRVNISAYPMEPPEIELKGKARYHRSHPSDDKKFMEEVEAREPEKVVVAGELNIDAPAEGGLAPDEARERAGLPVTSPQRVSVSRNLVTAADVVTIPPRAPDTTLEAVQSGLGTAEAERLAKHRAQQAELAAQPVRNRPGASPNFARSVDLQTRVNPDTDQPGVARVEDNIGSRQ